MFDFRHQCQILDTIVRVFFFYYYYARLFVSSAKPFRRLKGSILQLR